MSPWHRVRISEWAHQSYCSAWRPAYNSTSSGALLPSHSPHLPLRHKSIFFQFTFSCKWTNRVSPEAHPQPGLATFCISILGSFYLSFSSVHIATREATSKTRMKQDLVPATTLCRDSGLLSIYSVNPLISLLIVQGKPNKVPCLSQLLLILEGPRDCPLLTARRCWHQRQGGVGLAHRQGASGCSPVSVGTPFPMFHVPSDLQTKPG